MSSRQLVPEVSRPGEDLSQKSTLVSLVPFPIIENKPGLIPGQFDIEASTDGKPRVLVIGESIHYVWIDETRGSLRVINPSYLVAKSVVNDYLGSQLEVGPDAHPALFFLVGVWTPEMVTEKHSDRLTEFGQRQLEWFTRLVRLADDDWQRTRQHFAISDLQRYAAQAIDPENKAQRAWVFVNKGQEVEAPLSQACPACGSEIPRGVVVCRFCQNILDPVRYQAMTFAKTGGIDLAKLTRQ